ncbi:MAG: DUF4198 domain-containing protein [Hydrococcus sp. Prado102]|jgi:nickel transport protein|nr:DUF4198 domain-containing protein [Hydrococcus sp. Prado102]
MLDQTLKKLSLTVAFLPLILSQPALAHVIWFDYNDGNYEVLFGHPEEEAEEPLIPSNFREATAYDLSKGIVPSNTSVEGGNFFVVPEREVAALTATYDNGFWIEYPDGSYENLSPEEAQAINYENVTNYLKSTKALYSWSDEVATPFGLPLEIMPLENPFAVGVGDSLSIQVLYQGNAIADPTVEYLGQELAVDANGIASVLIGEGGLQVIEASYDDPTANNPGISYATTLTAQTITAQSTSVPEPSFLLAFGVIGATTLALKRNRS